MSTEPTLSLPVRACLHRDMTPPRIKIESHDTVVIDRLVNDAHAEEIVRRINHHDALVDALKRILACPDINEDILSPETIAAADQARDVLRKINLP